LALTFYYGSGSPYAWRLWLAVEHKSIPYERRVEILPFFPKTWPAHWR
jgi:glutathione S-transferase